VNRRSILACLLVPSLASAADRTVQASATILRPRRIRPLAQMNFGGIVMLNGDPSEVTLHCNGAVTHEGPTVTLDSADHLRSRSPIFEVESGPRTRYFVEVRTGEHFEVRREGGVETMPVRLSQIQFGNAVHHPVPFPAGPNPLGHPSQTGLTQHNGTDIFRLGAVLKVNLNQRPGVYRGAFRVTIRFE